MTAPEKKIPAPMRPEEILGEFGRRVRKERRRLDITQEQLAEYVNVSDDTIKRIEKGQSVKLDVAFNIALVLGVPVQSLLPGQGGTDGLCSCNRK
ncbi:helix-turn-helix transcriptional regulator [Anaerotruncus rubiinfantis]|uniref:helix-turn-helix transcriptional regulator n=1 Tax=Anaerotruncus rubiinfantis TaxID=1720200 RepID=UPI0011C8502F|nr:helix-turn-helix transcriptional regulator [Anaerotruncus rubiinfantis]